MGKSCSSVKMRWETPPRHGLNPCLEQAHSVRCASRVLEAVNTLAVSLCYQGVELIQLPELMRGMNDLQAPAI